MIFSFIKRLTKGQRGVAGIGDNPVFIIDNAFQLSCCDVKHRGNTAGHTLEEPNVGNRNCKFNVSHTFTTDFAQSNFHTATVADDTFVLDPFVFSAVTFPVAGRSENTFTEQTAFFRLQTSVIDGFRILNLTVTPGPDHFGRSHFDDNRFKCGCLRLRGCILAVSGYIAVINHSSVPPAVSFIGISERFSARTSRARLCISLSRTLKDSGLPASRTFSPLTMDS